MSRLTNKDNKSIKQEKDYILSLIDENTDKYMVDVEWFDKIHCRRPLYTCVNFYEYFILNKDNQVIDSIKLYPKSMGDRFVIVDGKTYTKIKKYMEK